MLMRVIHVVLAAFLAHAPAWAQSECGRLDNGYGPFDYRTASKKQIETVERYHFTDNVASLRRGESTTRIGGDIDYTLRAFPNHPRALASMAELARRQKRDPPIGSSYSVSCWFERAMRFRPNDGMVHNVYGVALLKSGKSKEAIDQLAKANELIPNNANIIYNLGLAHFEHGTYDESLRYAKRAYELGFPLPGLRNMLTKAGRWK